MDVDAARFMFVDINSTWLGIYNPMTVEFIMPETSVGNNIPAATICRVEIAYVGEDVACLQKDIINNPALGLLTYESRFFYFEIILKIKI